jgi:hypothetical protein
MYYKTIFYNNVYDTTQYTILADQTEKIIEEEDINIDENKIMKRVTKHVVIDKKLLGGTQSVALA